MYEEMIVSGAWWDYVDEIAIRRLGPDAAILRTAARAMRALMLAWSRDPDPWKRRSAIICQVGAKKDTDLGLLYACIEPNLADPEFFLRKGIGWALRAYAWADPAEVARYVARTRGDVAPVPARGAQERRPGGSR